MYFFRGLSDDHLIAPDAACFPIRLPAADGQDHRGLFSEQGPIANLSKAARQFLFALGFDNPDADAQCAALIWMHALAVGYSSAYQDENAGGLRGDWPRIPLPPDRASFESSAALGEQIAALLDTETAVSGVTSGTIAPALKTIALVSRIGGGALDPTAGDLAVTAGWGHPGKAGVTMPARGRIESRPYDTDEAAALSAEAAARQLSADEVHELLGATTRDVFLNDRAYWRNIPEKVWDYHIGGYQVIKKWLSYREDEILGRDLRPEEAREVTSTARRITAILLLQPQLDENYRRIKAAAFDWSRLRADQPTSP